MIAAISPNSLYFQLHSESIKSLQVIQFLKALQKHFKKQNLLILWDRATIHRSKALQKYIQATNNQITIEYLPPYAPELNPVEYIWANLKQHQIPNLCVRDLQALSFHAQAALRRLKRRPQIIMACFAHSNLFP